MVKNNKFNVIGKPINVFRTTKNEYPSNMFQDRDRDGVMNAFDCKPFDPNKQGFIDAVVGAVKGMRGGSAGIKSGWKEGMAKPPRNMAARVAHQERREKAVAYAREKVRYQKAKSNLKKYNRKETEEIVRSIPGAKTMGRVLSRIQQANPTFQRKVRVQYYQEQLRTGTPKQKKKAEYLLAKMREVQSGKIQSIRTRAVESVFPIKSISSYGSAYGRKTIPGQPGGGRGRPRGTLDKKYAAYGGVYGWRRYLSEQRIKQKEQLKQQIQQMKQQRVPQYEQQQYQGQTQVNAVPQELQGQGITPEYSQAQQYQQVPQQQYQQQYQQPQQYQQQPFQYLQQQRQIVPVFKSQGGSPYPAVDRRPLTPPQQTIPYGYVETVDSFTGKRYLKPLPRREGWTR